MWLFIGDSFTVRLKNSGLLNPTDIVIAKSGTAPRDWYDCENNEKFVDYMSELQQIAETNKAINGIIFLYGVNDCKKSYDVYYGMRLIKDIRLLFPSTPIYVQKVFPVATTYNHTSHTFEQMNREGEYNISQYNSEIEYFCSTLNGVQFIDTTDGFITVYGNLKKGKTEDGLHIAEEYIDEWLENIRLKTNYV